MSSFPKDALIGDSVPNREKSVTRLSTPNSSRIAKFVASLLFKPMIIQSKKTINIAQHCSKRHLFGLESRRRPDSNWGMELLQSSALPLGYGAGFSCYNQRMSLLPTSVELRANFLFSSLTSPFGCYLRNGESTSTVLAYEDDCSETQLPLVGRSDVDSDRRSLCCNSRRSSIDGRVAQD